MEESHLIVDVLAAKVAQKLVGGAKKVYHDFFFFKRKIFVKNERIEVMHTVFEEIYDRLMSFEIILQFLLQIVNLSILRVLLKKDFLGLLFRLGKETVPQILHNSQDFIKFMSRVDFLFCEGLKPDFRAFDKYC